MDEATPQPQTTTAKRWRDDPLSVFLAIAAVLLGLMYVLEQRDVAVLDEASARAHALGARLGLDGCTAGSASTDGEMLVLECASSAADAAARAASAGVDFAGFTRVAIAGADAILLCPADRRGWPQGCTSAPRPTGIER